MNSRLTARALLGAAALITAGLGQAYAAEPGSNSQTPGGITIGPGAGAPPPGLYTFDQFFTIQQTLVGPGANGPNTGASTHVGVDVAVKGLLFVPGWTFLGGTYDAVIAQGFANATLSSPLNGGWNPNIPGSATGLLEATGLHNTLIIPVELSWHFGNIGILAGLGLFAPDGSISGPTGLNSVGSPWWTFQPEFKISYLADGLNLTANIYDEINTKNTITNYTSGQVLHADFTATKTIGKWTIGPVAYYQGQITDDVNNGNFYGPVGNLAGISQRYNVWAVGGLVGYDFGPASLTVWALDDVSATVSNCGGVTASAACTTGQGWRAYASLSYRLWAPEAPASHAPRIVK
jgi:hypothetical protein